MFDSPANRPPSRGAKRLMLTLGLLATPALGGCDLLDELVSVDIPSQIVAEDLENPANAQLLVTSTVADFECAMANYTVAAGLLGNELADASAQFAWWDYDRRTIVPGGFGDFYGRLPCSTSSNFERVVGVYVPLSVARWQADNALAHLQDWTDEEVANRSDLIATAAAYSGYGHLLLGEGMCTVALDGSAELEPADAFTRAEERFGTAMAAAQAAGNDDMLNMARVGRARARLNLGDVAGAGEDAGQVPDGFAVNATYASVPERRQNQVYLHNNIQKFMTVGTSYRGMIVGGVADPRVPVSDAGELGNDGTTALWVQTKYASLGDPIPLATWEEARLMEAEAELAAGNTQNAVGLINELHQARGLPAFASSDPTEVMDQVMYERRAELFLESQHLGDLRRYDLPLVPAPGAPFKEGGTYADQRCFPLPNIETLNNPAIGG